MNDLTIFIASSEELNDERNVLGDLFRRLNDIYELKGISIKLKMWEDFDASYQGCRTQDVYNQILTQCDMFVAIFHKKAGQFTVEEFDVARDHFEKFSSPKVYTYMKDLVADETEEVELTNFKSRLFHELGHYWCRFANNETMQLHIVMQIQILTSNKIAELEIKDSNIFLGNQYWKIANQKATAARWNVPLDLDGNNCVQM